MSINQVLMVVGRTPPRVVNLLLAGLLALGASAALPAEVELRIMETTDLHMHLLDYDYYRDSENPTMGLARTASLIKTAREESPNSVLVDNGDLLQGNPMGDYVARGRVLRFGEVHPAYKAMNLLLTMWEMLAITTSTMAWIFL